MPARKTSSSPAFSGDMRIVALHGPEAYLRQEYSKQYIETLREQFGEIDEFRFDGETTEPAALLDELRSYGLLQQHKLVILDDADLFITPKGSADDEDAEDDDDVVVDDASSGGTPRRKLLERYAANPVDHASLLMRARTWRPGNLDKLIKKVGVAVKCEPVKPHQATGWAIKRCEARHGCTIDRAAATRLVGLIGPELGRLDTELAKLASFAGEGGVIDDAMVRDMVGLSREEKAWVIQEAVLSGDPGEALAKLREITLNEPSGVEVPLMWAMIDLSRKVHHASRLLRQGIDGRAIGRQLRLWGESERLVLQAARDLEPDEAAQILRKAIDTDLRMKTGRGSGLRTVEALAAFLADTIGRGSYAPM